LRQSGDFLLQDSANLRTYLLPVNDAAANALYVSVGRHVRLRASETSAAVSSGAAPQQPSGTPDPAVPVTQLPQSAQAGDGTEGFRGNAPNHTVYVMRVEAVLRPCGQ
jgi:hypothetical protein